MSSIQKISGKTPLIFVSLVNSLRRGTGKKAEFIPSPLNQRKFLLISYVAIIGRPRANFRHLKWNGI
jgi:hypothetical protein